MNNVDKIQLTLRVAASKEGKSMTEYVKENSDPTLDAPVLLQAYGKFKVKEIDMKINTKAFGEIEVSDDKIIEMPEGILGFPDLKKYVLLHNSERGNTGIAWFQSIDEPGFAMPVLEPLAVFDKYTLDVPEAHLNVIGNPADENILVLVTMTIPKDRIEDMTVNMKAPIIVNSVNNKAIQVILDDDQYKIKEPIYSRLHKEV